MILLKKPEGHKMLTAGKIDSISLIFMFSDVFMSKLWGIYRIGANWNITVAVSPI